MTVLSKQSALELVEQRRAEKIREMTAATGKKSEAGLAEGPEMRIEAVHAGVTATWLSQALSMNVQTVKHRLGQCSPIERRKAGYVYDLKTALPYLMKPKVDIEQYLRTVKMEELPLRVQESYWAAKLKQQRYEAEAGHLWSSDHVIDLFTELFREIRSSLQLFSDNLERVSELSDKQNAALEDMIDALQNDIYRRVEDIAGRRKTRSTLHEEVTEARAKESEIEKKHEYDFSDVL